MIKLADKTEMAFPSKIVLPSPYAKLTQVQLKHSKPLLNTYI